MAHLMESMFSVREVPWHGLGTIVEEAPTAAEAIKLAGLDWNIEQKPIFHHYEDGTNKEVAEYKALVRSDNQKTLSVMKNSYTPYQNKSCFDWFSPFVESGLAKFETAGSLRDGKVVWVLATLNKAPLDVGGGDLIQKYLLLSTSHDGTMANRVGFTPTRVVCNNTLSAAHSSGASELVRVRHSKQVAQRMDQLQDIVNAMDAKFEATAEQYKALTKTYVNQKDLEKYVNVIFKLNPLGDEREALRAAKMQEQIIKLFENGAGSDLKSAKGTMWGAYNAVTEYLTHESKKDQEAKLFGNWFGDLMRVNNQALDLALEAV